MKELNKKIKQLEKEIKTLNQYKAQLVKFKQNNKGSSKRKNINQDVQEVTAFSKLVNPNFIKALELKTQIKDYYLKRILNSNEKEFESYFNYLFISFDPYEVKRANQKPKPLTDDWSYYFTHYCYTKILDQALYHLYVKNTKKQSEY